MRFILGQPKYLDPTVLSSQKWARIRKKKSLWEAPKLFSSLGLPGPAPLNHPNTEIRPGSVCSNTWISGTLLRPFCVLELPVGTETNLSKKAWFHTGISPNLRLRPQPNCGRDWNTQQHSCQGCLSLSRLLLSSVTLLRMSLSYVVGDVLRLLTYTPAATVTSPLHLSREVTNLLFDPLQMPREKNLIGLGSYAHGGRK